ncbi:hypothetical protein Hanom_Chr15g01380551 [Helianthus anomalus]
MLDPSVVVKTTVFHHLPFHQMFDTWSVFSLQIKITAATSAITFSLNKTLIKSKRRFTLSN